MRHLRRLRTGAWPVLLLLVASSFLSLWRLHPRVGDADTPVSLANLKRHLAVIAAEPHPVGSDANRRVRDYLLGELHALGFSPTTQAEMIANPRGELTSFENIICHIPGTGGGASDRIILASHYDSATRAPGAGDDGAAVAATLEVARLLRKRPTGRDVILLITDGEEAGLLGAQVFARRHPDAMGATLVLNFEARGSSGPSVMFQSAGLSRALLAAYAAASPQPVTSSLADEVYRRMPNDTDFTIFAAMGLPGLNFAFFDGYANYHTPRDDIAHLSDATLLHHAAQAWALVTTLANGEARGAKPSESLVFFDLLGWRVVRYGTTAAWSLAIFALAVSAVAVRRLRPSVRGTALWIALLLLHLLAATAWVHFAVRVLPIAKQTHRWTPFAFAAAALVVVGGIVLIAWLMRRTPAWPTSRFKPEPSSQRVEHDALAALLILLAIGAVSTTALLPGGSYPLVWPSLLTGVAALFPQRHWQAPALAISAALSTLVLLPLAWLVTVALRLELLAAGAALLGLLSWTWFVALTLLMRRRRQGSFDAR